MEKHYYSIILLALTVHCAIAQNSLQYGQGNQDLTPETPYVFWDVLREDGYGWIREKRELETDPWGNYFKTESQKDGYGKFTLLQNATWATGIQAWNIDHRFKYIYSRDAGGKLMELVDDQHSPLGAYGRKWMFEYDSQGKLAKATVNLKSGPNYINYLIRYYFFSNGLRVKDSTLVYNGAIPELASTAAYKYDANNRCTTKMVFWPNQSAGLDTVQIINCDYNGDGKLKLFEDYTFDVEGGPLLPQKRIIYTYTQAGKIQDMLTSYRNTANSNVFNEYPSSHYTHYYNTQGKLTAMTLMGRLNTGVWQTEDSVALHYLPNGQLDTGYEYIFSGGALKSYATYRLVFENIHTSIKHPDIQVTGLAVYPNPVKDILTISLETVRGGSIIFKITDITGRQVHTVEAVGLSAGKDELQVNMAELPPGIYFLTCGSKTVKISKE